MSIEERRSHVTEYRLKGKGSLDWPIIINTAERGEVRTTMYTFETVAQIEEYIEALRKAAKEANLPDGPSEAKSA
jgi:hypothetical protein